MGQNVQQESYMTIHQAPGAEFDDSHGNSRSDNVNRVRRALPVRKVPADSVPFGDSISRNGRTVWAGFDGDRVVCIAATSGECRTKWLAWERKRREQAAYGGRGMDWPYRRWIEGDGQKS